MHPPDDLTGDPQAPDDPARDDAGDEFDNDRLLRRIKEWYRQGEEAHGRWRKQADEDDAFAAGHQWSDEDLLTLREQDRPSTTFDRVGPIIDVVLGMEVGNRQEVACKQRSEEDALPAEAATRLVEWVRDRSEADEEEHDSFRDLLIKGMGCVEVRPTAPDEEIEHGFAMYERTDPMEMRWPPSARKRGLADARWLVRVRTISRLDAELMFPDVPEWQDLDAAWARDFAPDGTPVVNEPDLRYRRGQDADDEETPDDVTLVEAQWFEKRTVYPALNPTTGQVEEVDAETAEVLRQRNVEIGPPRTFRVVRRAYAGRVVLSVEDLPVQGLGFSYKFLTGKWDARERVWYGLVRAAKEPQRYANKWLAMSVEILAAGAKGGLLAERDAFEDEEQAKREWASPRGIVWLSTGAIAQGKVQPKPATQYPQGWDRLLTLAMESIHDSTGVNLEILGSRQQQQAGVLEYQRKQASVTILAVYFDALKRARRSAAELLLAYILELMTDEEMARILGPEMQSVIPLLRQKGVRNYDIVIDDSPTSPNAKERTWLALQPIMPMLAQLNLGPEIWAEIVRASPLPAAFSEKVVQALEQQGQPDPAQQMMKEIAVAAAAAGVQKDQARAARDMAEAKQTEAETLVNVHEAGARSNLRSRAIAGGVG